jgi:hypothetical protein
VLRSAAVLHVQISDGSGQAVPGASVSLLPRAARPTRQRVLRSDAAGVCRFTGVDWDAS